MEDLRKEVKLLKALQNVSYKELSGYLEITQNAFYNWLNGSYELSYEKKKRLSDIISDLRE